MGWESFERWPDESPAGGAFRGRSEPVVARRDGVTLRERWRLFWKHSPDHDSKRAVKRAMLTPTHLYVERLDGSTGRLPRSSIRACRRMDHRMLFGIEDGEDLILMHREEELQWKLVDLAGGSGDAWTRESHHAQAIWFTLFAFGIAAGLFGEYSFAGARDRWANGNYTAEVCLGIYAGLFALGAGIAAIAWIPSRVHIDRLGVERARGFLGLFKFHIPSDRVTLVVSQHATPGFETKLIFDEKVYIGTLRRTRGLTVAKFQGFGARNVTLRLSERLRSLLVARHRNLLH